MIFAGLDVNLDFGEAGDVGKGLSVVWILVTSRDDQTLACQRVRGRPRVSVHIRVYLMTVVDAAQLNRFLSSLSQRHAGAAALAEDTFVGDLVILRIAAQALGGDLLQPLLGLHADGVCGAGHGVRGLAAARHTAPRHVLTVRAPAHVALLPRHTQHFGGHAMHIDDSFRSEVADSGLEADASVGFDQRQAIETRRTADVATHGDADAAHFGANALGSARDSFAPVELFRAAIERLLNESAGGVRPLSSRIRRSEGRLAFGGIDLRG